MTVIRQNTEEKKQFEQSSKNTANTQDMVKPESFRMTKKIPDVFSKHPSREKSLVRNEKCWMGSKTLSILGFEKR